MTRELKQAVSAFFATPPCHGNADEHCCYWNGKQCPHIEEGTVPGRRWACGLFRRYGSWGAMNESVEYRPVGEWWKSIGQPFNYCETFDPAFCCQPEYRRGRANEKSPLPNPVVT